MPEDKRKRDVGEAGEETFFERWSRLKNAGGEPEAPVEVAENESSLDDREAPGADDPPPVLTDADMPDLDAIDEHSDVSGFLSPGVSEGLRRKALRKLFTGAKFNIRDGLDDYDDDFRSFTPLGGVVTADMRHHLERKVEAAKAMAEKRLAKLDDESPDAAGASEGSGADGAISGDTGPAAAGEDENAAGRENDSDEESRNA